MMMSRLGRASDMAERLELSSGVNHMWEKRISMNEGHLFKRRFNKQVQIKNEQVKAKENHIKEFI